VERSPVDSSAIVSAGYDAEQRTLELEWKNGRVYQYLEVPQGTFEWLLRAKSKGAYFSRMIDQRYAFREVTPPDPRTQADLAATLQASIRDAEDR
jgi:hypothetical protein